MNKQEIIDYTIDQFETASFTNSKGDRGGPTKFGISEMILSQYRQHPCSLEDVHNMGREEAVAIYAEIFWMDANITALPYELQHCVFDMGVMSGTRTAARILQRCLKVFVDHTMIVDGSIGQKTAQTALELIHIFGVKGALTRLAQERIDHYEDIVKADPTQAKWINGWKNRAQWFVNNLPAPMTAGSVSAIR